MGFWWFYDWFFGFRIQGPALCFQQLLGYIHLYSFLRLCLGGVALDVKKHKVHFQGITLTCHPSKREPDAELDEAGATGGAAGAGVGGGGSDGLEDAAEAGIVEVGDGLGEVGVVEQVHELAAEFEVHSFGAEAYAPDGRQIDVVQAGAGEDVATGGAGLARCRGGEAGDVKGRIGVAIVTTDGACSD